MITKTQFYSELAANSARHLTESRENWTEYLTTAARLFKYPFHEQIMIYSQRPNVTACATIEDWNNEKEPKKGYDGEVYSRWVKRGSKGIALVYQENGKTKLKHVFDYSDTASGWHDNTKRPIVWEMRKEYETTVIDALSKAYSNMEGTLDYRIHNIAYNLAEDYYNNNALDILNSVEDSYLEGLDEYDLKVAFREALTMSVSYSIMSRCGLNPNEFYADDDFSKIFDFNTFDSVNALGTAVSELSEQVLWEIERAILKYEREIAAKRSTEHEDTLNVHQERGLSDSQPNTQTADGRINRQIRANAAESHTGTPQNTVQFAGIERTANAAFDGNRRNGEPEIGAVNEGTRTESPASGQSGESDRVGTTHEQLENDSRENYNERTDLRIENRTEEAENETASFDMPEHELTWLHAEWNERLINDVLRDKTVLNSAVNSDRQNTLTEIEAAAGRIRAAIRQEIINSSVIQNKGAHSDELDKYFDRERTPPFSEQLYNIVINSEEYSARTAETAELSEQPDNFAETAIMETSVGFLLSQEDIDTLIIQAIEIIDNKKQIQDEFSINYRSQSAAFILKEAYDDSNYSCVLPDGSTGTIHCTTDDKNRITFTKNDNGNEHEIDWTWGQLRDRVKVLVETGQYITANDLVNEENPLVSVGTQPRQEEYRYYSVRRPVDIGSYPRDIEPSEIVNFDNRQLVENGLFEAWGYLVYPQPLTDAQINDYELRVAPEKQTQQINGSQVGVNLSANDGFLSLTDIQQSNITLDTIDAMLRDGGNKKTSVMRITAHFMKGKTPEENAEFIEREYGRGGKGLRINGERYTSWFDANGMLIAEGTSALDPIRSVVHLSWAQVEQRVSELLQSGHYIPQHRLDAVPDFERKELADKLLNLYVDTEDEYRYIINGDILQDRISLDEKEQTAEILAVPEHLESVIKNISNYCEEYEKNPDMLRYRRLHNPRELLGRLEDLRITPVSFTANDIPSVRITPFVTSDDINAVLTEGSNFQEGKFRIYSYFLHEHNAKERVDFLKDEYGTGGSSHAVFGAYNSWENHDAKGIEIIRGNLLEPDDKVIIAWSRASRLIDNLISEGKYMTREQLDYLPEYEKNILAREIARFYHDLPDNINRPFFLEEKSYNLFNDNEIKAIRSILEDTAQVDELIEAMRPLWEATLPEDRYYDIRQKAYADLIAYRDGTYTLFPQLEAADNLGYGLPLKRDTFHDESNGEPGEQLSLFFLPTEEEQQRTVKEAEEKLIAAEQTSDVSISIIEQSDIDVISKNWNGDFNSKIRVYEHMLEYARVRNTANVLKTEYGGDLAEFTVTKDGADSVTLTWPKIQRHIAQLIDDGQFLSPEEQAVYDQQPKDKIDIPEISPQEQASPVYAVGDEVYLENDRHFIIRDISDSEIRLLDTGMIIPIGRSMTIEDFEWLLSENPLNAHFFEIPQIPETPTVEPQSAEISVRNTPYEKYLSAKEQYPDHVIVSGLGSFVELFGDDAVNAANTFGYTLINYNIDDQSIPFIGIPDKDADSLIEYFNANGRDVAFVNLYGVIETYLSADYVPEPESERYSVTVTSDAFDDPEDVYAIWDETISDYYIEDGTIITFADETEAKIYCDALNQKEAAAQETVFPRIDRLLSEDGTDYYLFHVPETSENPAALSYETLSLIGYKADKYVICADVCYYSPDDMARLNIEFRKMPRDFGLLPEVIQQKIAEVRPDIAEAGLKTQIYDELFERGYNVSDALIADGLSDHRGRGGKDNYKEIADYIEAAVFTETFSAPEWEQEDSARTEINRQEITQSQVKVLSEIFGLDESLLNELIEAQISESTINEYGRFDRLVDSVDRTKAEAYFSNNGKEPIRQLTLSIKIYDLLRDFVLDGSFDIALEQTQAATPSQSEQFPFFNYPLDSVPAVSEAEAQTQTSASITIADFVKSKLETGEKFTSVELFAEATKAYGDTMANNAFTSKDAYDAMELGVNQYILSLDNISPENMVEILDLLPTQTRRTADMERFQQFSTPPSIAYIANWAANVSVNDIVLEPSAGIGGIAVFAKKDGAKVYVNELDKRRLEIIRNLPFDGFFNEDAEQINNIHGDKIAPTVIVMNPPFASSAERNIQNNRIGAKHIEEALKILAPNGRLIAIAGQGMADDAPAFRNWWSGIKEQYNVKANIGIDGKNYNKYGTNFGIQMMVIDKDGATTEPVKTAFVENILNLQNILGGIRNDRPSIQIEHDSGNERNSVTATHLEADSEREPGREQNDSVSDTGGRTDTAVSRDRQQPTDTSKTITAVGGNSGVTSGLANVNDNGTSSILNTERHGGNDGRNDGDNGVGRIGSADSGQFTRSVKPRIKTELTDSIFELYEPKPLLLENVQTHPANISESAAMSAIEPPPVTYKPNINQDIIDKGILSDVQLEAVTYAGQSHSQTLPNGNTRGFFLGDGTGVGKGRTITGIILDNYVQGSKKAVWLSENRGLIPDAKRDVKALFGDSDLVVEFQGGKKADASLSIDEGILFVTYSALSKSYDQSGSNFEKIVNWLGKDFDGVIIFDEAHNMANSIASKGTRGIKKASQRGMAGLAIQESLPNAKFVYSSATGATEVENLRYAERLGLWGEGTAFANGNDFVSKIKAGGLAAMELIARDMKAMGVYLSRNISYEDVVYDKIVHELTPEQRKIYDELARAWQIVLKNIKKALETTNQDKDGRAKGEAYSAFWGAEQRFFNQILTAMQVPSMITDIQKQLDDGNSIVIQLVSTNESAQEREFARLQEQDLELDDFDLTPKQMLMSYIENSFPTVQFEEYVDDNGNTKSKPVFDSEGNAVINREALRQKEMLLDTLGSIKVPSSALDMVINHFGSDMVAENTGRKRRVVVKDGKAREENIANKKEADVTAFQNGDKRIIIFSKAGGTGKSYHADKSAKNQQHRVHYLLQAGWQADAAVQGFGRSHRSNQVSAPTFTLITTDLKGQMRFISTIAKRLDQLGALTKGQRQTGSQGLFTAGDNLENAFAADVLSLFYKVLIQNGVRDVPDGVSIIEKLGLKDKLIDEYGQINALAPELREVNKFLNRILSLECHEQNAVFDGYAERLQAATEKAMQDGTLDKGLENYKADKVVLNETQAIRVDEATGATTKYYNLTAYNKIKPLQFYEINTQHHSFVGFYQNEHSEAVRAAFRTSSTTDERGNIYDNYRLTGQDGNEYISQDRLDNNWNKLTEKEAGELWNDAVAELPEFRTNNLHLIGGTVLPVWDKLPTENVRIYRVLTTDGELLIGRVIPESMIDATLRQLGASREKEDITTEDLLKGIKSGDTVYLDNGWRITQKKVSNEQRIEVIGASFLHSDLLNKKGVFTERINYQTRYFIPAVTDTVKILDEVIKISPVNRVENNKEHAAANSTPSLTNYVRGKTAELNPKRSLALESSILAELKNNIEVIKNGEKRKTVEETSL